MTLVIFIVFLSFLIRQGQQLIVTSKNGLQRAGHPASDYSCLSRGFWYQLKSQKSRIGDSITDGAYAAMMNAIHHDEFRNFATGIYFCTLTATAGVCREHFFNAETRRRKYSECIFQAFAPPARDLSELLPWENPAQSICFFRLRL